MDKTEAKLILSSYTLGNEPDHDPRFEQARQIAASDPELAQWWQTQQQGDQLIRDRLASFKTPSDLRSALAASVSHQKRRNERLVAMRSWFAVAATIVIAAVLYFQFGVDRSDDYTGPLVERAYQYSVDGPRLTYFNRDTQKLKDWLVDNHFDLPKELPPKLLDLEGVGCRPLDWSENGVALMCFNADTVYHLFVATKDDFPDFEASEKIDYDHYKDGWTISKWDDRDFVFVLTAKTTPDKMSGYLASYTPGER